MELAKALNSLGDYRLSTALNTSKWALPSWTSDGWTGTADLLPEFDYDSAIQRYRWDGSIVGNWLNGRSIGTDFGVSIRPSETDTGNISNAVAGNMGSSCFCMAIDLETSNGLEISGLNASEQSDISFIARYSAAQKQGFVFDVFTYIDSMIVLKENNVLELIQ